MQTSLTLANDTSISNYYVRKTYSNVKFCPLSLKKWKQRIWPISGQNLQIMITIFEYVFYAIFFVITRSLDVSDAWIKWKNSMSNNTVTIRLNHHYDLALPISLEIELQWIFLTSFDSKCCLNVQAIRHT